MRPQDSERFPGEGLYYDNGELVAESRKLAEAGPVPSVELMPGTAIICSYVTADGRPVNVDHGVLSWNHPLAPGDQVSRIVTGGGLPKYTANKATGNLDISLGEEALAAYEIRPGDKLIVGVKVGYKTTTEVVPADEPLPQGEGGKIPAYDPVSIITAEGQLVAWGMDGAGTKQIMELIAGHKLAANKLEAYIVGRATRDNALVARFGINKIAKAYVAWFKETSGVDFEPYQDPVERQHQLPGELTREQIERYRFS